MKPMTKYVQLLESDVKLLREQLLQARNDIEFYRGKVERLEISLMSVSNVPAQADYAQRTMGAPEPDPTRLGKIPARMPFAEVKRKWNALTAEEQEKAVAEGRLEFEKEENNAGS